MVFKAAFIFVAPKTERRQHRSVICTPEVELTVVGVSNYREAVAEAEELVAAGVSAFELCAGFGVEGVAALKQAVGSKAIVGVVRFDCHPGLGFKSGDELFA